MTLQNVRAVLADLEDDPDYQAFAEEPIADQRFHEFWGEVNVLAMLCMQIEPAPPTEHEVRERLDRLRVETIGTLFRFRPFIDRAIAVLDEGRSTPRESRERYISALRRKSREVAKGLSPSGLDEVIASTEARMEGMEPSDLRTELGIQMEEFRRVREERE